MKKLLGIMTIATALTVSSANPQSLAADVHVGYSRGLKTDANSWGAGAALPITWGGSSSPIKITVSPGYDYMKQSSGPSTSSVGLDITAQPGGSSSLSPYAGGSISENWSMGDDKAWSGAERGQEAIVGLQYTPSPSSTVSWKIEERYGYIDEQEHTLTTHIGALIKF
jgi:hypothetical protein